MFWIYASAITADSGALISRPLVCNIYVQNKNNLVPLLFTGNRQ